MMAEMGMVMDVPWTVTDVVLTFVMWTVMMVAMMTPSAAPIVLLVAGMQRKMGAERLPLFAIVFTILSWVGLSWIYVITHFEYSSYLDSTKERVIASIVLAGAALTPLLVTEISASARGARGSGRLRSAAERTP